MTTSWLEVSKKEEYLKLAPEQREIAKGQYFDSVVAPRVPGKDLELARGQFFNHTKRMDIKDEVPSWIDKQVSGMIRGTQRIAGVGIGIVNSPLAFVWGSQVPKYKYEEDVAKLPWWDRELVAIGGGFVSAWRSISKKGDWGDLYGEYFKTVTGTTIEERLPTGTKWSAPTIEFLANVVSDPLIAFGEASRIASLRVPKSFKGTLPPEVLKSLERIEKLERAEKDVIRRQLLDALENRKGYMKWWEGKLEKLEEIDMVRRTKMSQHADAMIQPQLPAGQGFTFRDPSINKKLIAQKAEALTKVGALPPGQGFRLGSNLSDLQAQASKVFPKLDFTVDAIGESGSMLPEGLAQVTNRKFSNVFDKNYSFSVPIDDVAGGIRRKAAELKSVSPARESAEVFAKELRTVQSPKGKHLLAKRLAKEEQRSNLILPERITIEPTESGFKVMDGGAYAGISGKTEAVVLKKAKQRYGVIGAGTEDAARKTTWQYGTSAKATGGLVLGIGEDEDGNITYDIGKGLAGSLAVAGGLRLKNSFGKKFADTMGKNPSWAKVNAMVGETGRTFEVSGLFGRLTKNLFDRFYPLKAKGTQATYEAARKFSSYKDVAKSKFGELKDSLSAVKNDEVIVTDYITAQRALSRAERGLKNPNGVTLEDAQRAIVEIEAHYAQSGKNVEQLRNASRAFKQWTHDYILKDALDSGILSREGYNSIVKNNEWYATFDVLDHLPSNLDDIPSGITGEYFSVANQKIIKKMIGTEKKIANPLEATVRKFTEAQAIFARNKVANIFIDDPGAKQLYRPVAKSKKEFGIMKNQGLDPVMDGAWNKNEFGSISRFKNGRVEKYVANKDIADAMKQLTPWQAPRVVQGLNAIFRASATTLYLPFTISNAMRDALMAYTTAPVHRTPHKFIRDWGKGFKEGFKHEFLGKSNLAEEYIESGGGFGYVGDLRKAKLARSQLFTKGMIRSSGDIVTSPFKLIEKISATVELAPRLGTFDRAKILGLTSDDAALLARQSTIDFNRGGTLTKVANQFIPFLNARVQGRVNVAVALKDRPGQTLAKAFASTVVPGVAAYAWNRLYYSDLYDDIPEYIKDNYFTIIIGKDQDEKGKVVPKYLVISKGDLGQMSFNPIEFGLDKMWEKDKQGTGEFLVNYLSDLSPIEFAREGKVSASKAAGGLLPPIVKGFAEDWANLKFYQGTEVVPYWTGKTRPPELQYHENTPESYKQAGKILKISPLRLQNFAGNILAGYGREGLSMDSMVRGLTGRLMKTKGGAIEQRAWISVKDIESGYITARAYAEEAIKKGDRKAASQIMTSWNKGLASQVSEFNKEFQQYGLKDKGGLMRSYMFTPRKRKTILTKRVDEFSGIQKKLTRRKR